MLATTCSSKKLSTVMEAEYIVLSHAAREDLWLRSLFPELDLPPSPKAHYDANEAFREFDWIDRTFVPISQLPSELHTEERLKVAQSVIPTLRVRFNGQLLSSAPPRSKIIINLNVNSNGKPEDAIKSAEELERFVESLDDDEEDLEEDPDAVDRWDGPQSWFEDGETIFAADKSYVFCPAAHRKQILRIFIRHFCEHPSLPDRTGSTRTSAQIRYDSVHEMYNFCHQRGLREVWGYMWSAWYCPAKYRLWARSSEPNFIGRWRTTMAVENFWRNLKHDTLHRLLHPRLDQLIYLIITDVVPAFEAKMLLFDSNYRPGRPKPLMPWQKAFKAMWLKLAVRPLGTRAYKVDLLAFTCSCGQQKYNAFLLCKHLVQAFHPPDPAFFREIIRRRVTPFYRHSLLKPRDGSVLDCSMDDGSISDGDELGNTTELPQSPTVQVRGVKRKRGDDSGETAGRSGSAPGPTPASPILISSSPIRDDEEYDDVSRGASWLS
ncbi:hypothetical protein B0H13DRAFT_2301394 [Mycena leptocephala]|nr:hypothetical protein B0H13DRAFT_2301394 [Mycena leptocephala]